MHHWFLAQQALSIRGRIIMKLIVPVALAATFAFAGAAYAQDMMNCDQETFDKVMMEVDNSSDAAMKEKGMMELDMAKTAMEADKSDECAEHLDMAAKAVMME
jgi:pentapeptide MXKDX repeat protein